MTMIHADTDLEYWSRDYWLGHCEGFRVDAENRRLGFVEDIVGGHDEAEELVVRGGLFGNRVLRVPIDAIREIEPRAERILVRTDREHAW